MTRLIPTLLTLAACAGGEAPTPSPANAAPASAPPAAAPTPPPGAPAPHATAQPPAARPAPRPTAPDSGFRCVVVRGGETVAQGPCQFESDGDDGSFYVDLLSAAATAGTNPISVTLVGRGLAEVRGVTEDGLNSRWGEARRDKADRACWTGEDFTVCAWSTRPKAGVAPPEGVTASPAWGQPYAVAVLLAAPLGDAVIPTETAAQRARDLGVPQAALGVGLSCDTGLTAAALRVSPDASVVFVRFDDLAHAQAFAARYPGAQAHPARDTCGG